MRTYVPVSRYISYAKRVAAETETEKTAGYPQEKDRMKQTMSKPKSKKGRKRRKNKTSQHQERNKTARKGNTHTSGSQGARGVCTSSAETK